MCLFLCGNCVNLHMIAKKTKLIPLQHHNKGLNIYVMPYSKRYLKGSQLEKMIEYSWHVPAIKFIGVYMGCQNNTAVTVSRFKPIQCIACRFLRWLYVSRVDPLLSWVSFGKSNFQEKTFLQSASCNPYCQLILKSFVNAYSFIFNVTSLPNL